MGAGKRMSKAMAKGAGAVEAHLESRVRLSSRQVRKLVGYGYGPLVPERLWHPHRFVACVKVLSSGQEPPHGCSFRADDPLCQHLSWLENMYSRADRGMRYLTPRILFTLPRGTFYDKILSSVSAVGATEKEVSEFLERHPTWRENLLSNSPFDELSDKMLAMLLTPEAAYDMCWHAKQYLRALSLVHVPVVPPWHSINDYPAFLILCAGKLMPRERIGFYMMSPKAREGYEAVPAIVEKYRAQTRVVCHAVQPYLPNVLEDMVRDMYIGNSFH